MVDPFEFLDAVPASGGDTLVAIVPANVRGADRLFLVLADGLRFPAYFGFNWNALDECLSDFHWLTERAVVVAHVALPQIADAELRIYLDVLATAASFLKTRGDRSLRVTFDTSLRGAVDQLRRAT